MKIVIGSDHAAYEMKEVIKNHLLANKYTIEDVGTHSDSRCNYPDFAIKLAKSVQKNGHIGILLCGSGIGVSIVANKFKGIRAALCRSITDAKLSREHNDANVLCLGARSNTKEELIAMVDVWLATKFEGDRHIERLNIFKNLGE